MYCDAPRPKVVNSHHTADDIPTHVVKNKYFPDWVAIFVQYRSGVGDETAVARWITRGIFCRMGFVVEIKKFLN